MLAKVGEINDRIQFGSLGFTKEDGKYTMVRSVE